MAAELLRTGRPPGRRAPTSRAPVDHGGKLRLSDLRGQPVLLHFVSYTCPVTRGGISTMKELDRLFGDRVQFVEVLVRQATPASDTEPTARMEKFEDARAYGGEERIPWPVLVDDLAGTVQRAYGGLAAAVYLIDGRGSVAFCGTGEDALRQALEELLARGGSEPPGLQGHRPAAASGRCDRRRARWSAAGWGAKR